MRVGLFGGSFNPIHSGHLGIARRAVSDYNLDLLLFIPAKVNPFKVGAEIVGGFDDKMRMAMVDAVCSLDDKFMTWDIDLRRAEGPSYAIDTVIAAGERFPGAELFWLIGADNLERLHCWKDADKLQKLVKFISFPRTRESSTEIRKRILNGEAIDDLVPECVSQMIALCSTEDKE